MKFVQTRLAGAWLIELEPAVDERGFFARSWCQREFSEHGLDSQLLQCNISYNAKRGTLRGMHYQAAPHGETKLVRVTRGAIYDVLLDVRADSPTFGQWQAFELTADNRLALYIPEGLAHGFQTLSDDVDVFYQMGAFYHPQAARGIRWDDPRFAIAWPEAERIISERDRGYALWQDAGGRP